jgi:Phosphotransferase enzyme family
MVFILSSRNAFNYLVESGLCEQKEQALSQIESKSVKNFNLLVSCPNHCQFLIKQERHDLDGKTHEEFVKEWRIHQLVQNFPELSPLKSMISEAIHFDPTHSIIVLKYLSDYGDLDDFYTQQQNFPPIVAEKVGEMIARIHTATINREDYKQFLCHDSDIDKPPNFMRGLERIRIGIFSEVSIENLKFFKLYQRYESLGLAIAELKTAFCRCCLIHNDLKLDNILLAHEWESASSPIRLIDWEKFTWGDPAADLGRLIAAYLKIWLGSLIVSTDIDVQTALSVATTPLEAIQPSIVALVTAYLRIFPEIFELRPDFLNRVMQFTGLALIQNIGVSIQYHEPFDNIGICMLQVATTLLCYPQQSISMILGTPVYKMTA